MSNEQQEPVKYLKAYDNILMRKDLTSTAKLVLFRMMNRYQFFVTERGGSYTEGHKSFSKALGIGVTAVKQSIIDLNRSGFIRTTLRYKTVGGKETKELESTHYVDINYILQLTPETVAKVVEYSFTTVKSKRAGTVVGVKVVEDEPEEQPPF